MAVHAVCETTNLRAVHYAERIWDAVADIDIDNYDHRCFCFKTFYCYI